MNRPSSQQSGLASPSSQRCTAPAESEKQQGLRRGPRGVGPDHRTACLFRLEGRGPRGWFVGLKIHLNVGAYF